MGPILNGLLFTRECHTLALEVWASTWGLTFNPSKCTIFSIARSSAMYNFYTLCGTVLQHVSEAKYLGVTLSDALQWSTHISNLSVKASSTLCLLHRNLSQCPQALREQAYISFMRSRLEYCSAIWSQPSPGQRYRLAQEHPEASGRFTAQNYSRYTSVSALLKDLDWSPLKDRRRDIRLTFLFEIIKGKVAVQADGSLVAAGSRTRKRHEQKYIHLHVCTEQFRNSFFHKTYRSGTPCLTPQLLCQGGYQCRRLQVAAALSFDSPVQKRFWTLGGERKREELTDRAPVTGFKNGNYHNKYTFICPRIFMDCLCMGSVFIL